MTKKKFRELLNNRIQILESKERDRILTFYEETIDDSIEDGLTEEEAVLKLGDIEIIANDILSENGIDIRSLSERKPFGLSKKWLYTLAIIGSPIWLSLAVAAGMLIISVYLLLGCGFILIGCLWIAPLAVIASCILVIKFQISQNFPYTLMVFGIMLISCGLCTLLCLYTKQWIHTLISWVVKFSHLIMKQFHLKEAM